ncbi:ABC transporter permease [Aeromicrobium sp. SMF47]|uniref:ABC transporter permease n=1 Tax=Aeromicrobium yanjiei TaxID=2662028 RepID=UPI00129EFB26|nr:ABC transporter permease [Aeromicrobium yanjiei]MRJ75834.1 ABC transporter permease [Aeromicrobium yanjiei]
MEPSAESVAQKYPPPPPETPAERKGRMVALFVMPFLIVTMMYAVYMSTMHDPQPSDMPVAVVGTGAQAEGFADRLRSAAPDALDVRVVDDVSAVEELIAQEEITGAIEPPASGDVAKIYQASAGGASQASVVSGLLGPLAIAEGWETEKVELAPLPEGDGTGTMVLFAAMGMMLAGYVPLSSMLSGTPNLLRARTFLPIALGWGALTSSLIWLILGPLVGAVDGHYPLFLGVGTLAVMAVGVSQLLFTKVMGPFAVLLGMLLWVVFGVPSSGLAMAIDTMPGFFGWLHGVLPLPAAGEAIRSVIYFGGEGVWGHVRTLALWLVIPLVLVVLKDRRSDEPIVAGPAYTAPDAPLPALPGGPVASYRRRLFGVAAFPLGIMVTVVTLMSLSMHKPDLKDLPVAVVGAQASAFVDGVEPKLGDYVDLQVVDSADEAEQLIKKQEIAAAYVLPTAEERAPVLLTAGGAGASQKVTAVQMFGPIAAESGASLEIKDVAALTGNDTGGSNSLYVGMSWIMAGFLFFAVMRGGAPDLTRTRQLLPLVAGWSVGISVWLWFLFDVLIGAVNGHALALIGCGAFTVFAVAWASAVLIRLWGLGALVPVMIVVMLAGVPASGGGLSVYMVPEVFRWLSEVLPLPAAVDIARSLVYFDGTGIGGNLLVIALWGLAGLALNVLVVDRWLNRDGAKPHAPLGPKHMPEKRQKKTPQDDELVQQPA